jgi:UDP-N-acetyl-D-glucosamine dehydrogenase
MQTVSLRKLQEAASPIDIDLLLAHLRNREARLGVIGLGYVGLPLSLVACEAGFQVLGFDINREAVNRLNDGISPLRHIDHAKKIAAVRQGDRLMATSDPTRLAETDAILICVPTPLGVHREPDLSFIENTSRMLAKHLRRGQLVVLESTSYPGTTREVVRPILETSGLRSGVDFFLAYCPEREDPGNREFATARIPRVVAGDGEAALSLASTLYKQLVISAIPVSSLETAESVKLTENIFRAVNIALVNELKMVFAAIGVDIFEVVDAAKTKPFGYMPFYPGPGLGGHCIPIDPFYLTWKAQEVGICTRFIELAGDINMSMPRYVVGRLRDELDARFAKALSGSRVLIIGIAYKKNLGDMRESPALTIMEYLEELGAKVDYYDPYIDVIPPTRKHPALAGKASIPFEDYFLARYDSAVIVTDHDRVDYVTLLQFSKLVLDTRNVVATRVGHEYAHVVAKA